MTYKIVKKKMSAKEFSAALNAAELSVDDFVRITGRHRAAVAKYLSGEDENGPTLAEIVIVKLLVDKPGMKQQLLDIAQQWTEDTRDHSVHRTAERRARFGGNV